MRMIVKTVLARSGRQPAGTIRTTATATASTSTAVRIRRSGRVSRCHVRKSSQPTKAATSEEGDAAPRPRREDADGEQDDEGAERDGAGHGVESLHPGVGGVLETGTEAQGHATSVGDAAAYPGRVANALARGPITCPAWPSRHPSWTPSSASASAGASSSRAVRSTEARGLPGTTAPSASSSRRTSADSGGSRW